MMRLVRAVSGVLFMIESQRPGSMPVFAAPLLWENMMNVNALVKVVSVWTTLRQSTNHLRLRDSRSAYTPLYAALFRVRSVSNRLGANSAS